MVQVNSFRNLSHADLEQVMLVCEQLHAADPDQSFLQHCHTVLDPVFGHIHHSTEMYSLDPFSLTDLVNPTVNAYWVDIFNQHLMDHPYVERMLSSAPNHLATIQQEPGLKEFKQTALYNEFYIKVQGQNQLWLAYRDKNELLSCVYLRESEYSDTELSMSRMIHPHMEMAWRNWKRTRELRQELGLLKNAIFQSEEEEAAAARIRKSFAGLTPRQNEVIELLATGKDNQQIADELKISIFTVKKHLQTIFQTLEVEHRTELAARWHQAHSVSLHKA